MPGLSPTLVVPLLLEETGNLPRHHEPVTVGVPFPPGAVGTLAALRLVDPKHHPCPLQAAPLACWNDGSIQWALLDFQASVGANEQAVYQVQYDPTGAVEPLPQSVSVQQSSDAIVVDTGAGRFFLDTHVCKPFARVLCDGKDVLAAQGSRLAWIDALGQEYELAVVGSTVEAAGPLRATIALASVMRGKDASPGGRCLLRLSFYAGSRLVQGQITLHNPRAAHHPGGLWDLGDAGSLYFRDFSLSVPLREAPSRRWAWTADPEQALGESAATRLEVYQDSSGGAQWQSANHVNRHGRVGVTFQGYRVTADGQVVSAGARATPVLACADGVRGIAGTIDQFWQNFPKALEADGPTLTYRFFPQQYNDTYELQGGEQKRHTFFVQFAAQGEPPGDLRWVAHRLTPRATPEWYASSQAVAYLTPRQLERHTAYQALVDTAMRGPQTFQARREVVDEYGWRHFGDLYADHEAVEQQGEKALVSHYNNQYDAIYGAVVQYLRSGDRHWFELLRDLAKHVIDIDIYHTWEDRPAYNHGLFWHTDHYTDAATATHRTYSRATMTARNLSYYGGGPSNEHNYTTGLLHYYFLTGDRAAYDAVCGLADWVVHMDNGAHRRFGWLDRRPTGLSSATGSATYHGPGRGAGNSINALLDAYVLQGAPHYLEKAEALIRRCIHPRDDIAARQLDNVELRWSYTVFLQVLGKYLDLKVSQGDTDGMYSYAQASLLHYAAWMLEHEVPYKQVLHKVAIPTETWPAQDIRKCHVFNLAAKHAPEALRNTYLQRAAAFFQACITDLQSFETCHLTRPVVLLMTYGYVQTYFECHPETRAPRPSGPHDFGTPRRFRRQFEELYAVRNWLQCGMQMLHGLRQCPPRAR